MFVISAYAQNDVTKFLGIPVDGTKSEMIRKLKEKGFVYDQTNDRLTGEFNGTEVEIYVVTNNNKVYRIAVLDMESREETDIRIRFNKLCRQFENNSKYINLSFKDYTIAGDENISYEISVNKKRYEAVFYQKPTINSDDTDLDQYYNRCVWFMISKSKYNSNRYYINMFYDNEYNRANGEDL